MRSKSVIFLLLFAIVFVVADANVPFFKKRQHRTGFYGKTGGRYNDDGLSSARYFPT